MTETMVEDENYREWNLPAKARVDGTKGYSVRVLKTGEVQFCEHWTEHNEIWASRNIVEMPPQFAAQMVKFAADRLAALSRTRGEKEDGNGSAA
jgi:hypothetical protein